MQTVRLPRQLPAHAELLTLNRRLHAGEIRLDWRDVEVKRVTPQQLDTLFHGLALDLHIEYLDTNDTTISDDLSPLIMAAFARAENDIDATIARPIRTNSQALPPPTLWPPPTSASAARAREVEDEAERTLVRKRQPGLKRLLDDSTQALAETLERRTINVYRPAPRFVPVYEVPCNGSASELPALANLCLDMSELSYAETVRLPALLRPLPNAYIAWVEMQLSRPEQSGQDGQQVMQTTQTTQAMLQPYRTTLKRMQDSIGLLSTNQYAAQTFAFMNRAMWLQRIHTLWTLEKHSYKRRTMPDINRQLSNRSWQPFQLAFILLNIPTLLDARYTEPNATQGALADLRYFPTGSWMQEACLGLVAYTLGLRRLQSMHIQQNGHRVPGGLNQVSTILTYTSCQLTSQQFQHISALICACETIRRADSLMWGTTPFRLGFWHGSDEHMTQGAMGGEGSPWGERANGRGWSEPRERGESMDYLRLLNHCPWCGSPIEASYEDEGRCEPHEQGRTLLYCRDPQNECTFCRAKSPGEGLPVLIESTSRPTLLIMNTSGLVKG